MEKITQTEFNKVIKKNYFEDKEIPYDLILIIFSYLCPTNDFIKSNKTIRMKLLLKTIYNFMQCNWMFYKMFHFTIDNYFNKHYRNNIDLLNICRRGKIGFLKKISSNCIEISKKKKDEYVSNEVILFAPGASLYNEKHCMQENYPIILAAKNGHLNIIRELFSININCLFNKSYFEETALIIATKNRYIEIVDFIIKICCEDNTFSRIDFINIRDRINRTALHWACINGFPKIAELLCFNRGDLDIQDNQHKTPLMYAYEYGNYEVLWILKKKMDSIN